MQNVPEKSNLYDAQQYHKYSQKQRVEVITWKIPWDIHPNCAEKVLDKLIYADYIDLIDQSMSDSNIGARKRQNIKDHLFVVHAVINSVNRGEEECIDIQVYYIQKEFDSFWLNDTFNDLYDILPDEKRNDRLTLLYNINSSNLVAVNTPAGISERIDMPRIIQQG